MNTENELQAIERASRRWHSESVGTQLLRALAEAEERDAAVEKRAYRIPVPTTTIEGGEMRAIAINSPALLELLCLELDPEPLRHLTCERLSVGTLMVVEGAPLELLNRAWLSRLRLVPGVGVFMQVRNRCGETLVLQGSIVGLEPQR